MIKHAVRIAVLAPIAVGLIYFLVSRAGLTWAAFAVSMEKTAGWALVLFVALTGINLTFSALKWLIVLRDFEPCPGSQPGLAEAMLTTALGELLGQVMPVQAGIALTRSLASRLGVGWSLRGNLGTTIYEQVFDLTVVSMAAVVGLLGSALHIGLASWVLLVGLSILGGVFLSLRLPALLASQAHRIVRILGRSRLAPELQGVAKLAAMPSSVLAQLTALSILRYFSNVVRIIVLLGTLGLAAQAIPAMIGFPVVQLITALPITPGNLGVVEWTWSTVLVSSGATMGAAALFALTSRAVNIVALLILVAILLTYLVFVPVGKAYARN